MDIIYLVDYDISGDSGKNKATREKARNLSKHPDIEKFKFFHGQPTKSWFKGFFSRVFLDIIVARYLMKQPSSSVLIQRVLFMPLTRLVTYLKGILVVSEYHADFKEEIPFLNKKFFEKKILYFVSFFFDLNYKLTDAIIYNHPLLKKKFDRRYNKPSIYCYNGANIDEFYPEPIDECRNKLHINQEDIVFLFIGSVSYWHGVDYLIEVFNQPFVKSKKNWHLYIVGGIEGEYLNKIKQMSKNESVVFIPSVSTKEARCYINAADYCLLPVRSVRTSPGSPLKLYDYLACGKVVITQTQTLGYSDEVERYNAGAATDFADQLLCAKFLEAFVKQIDFHKNQRYTIRLAAETKASWDSRINSWLEFIKETRRF